MLLLLFSLIGSVDPPAHWGPVPTQGQIDYHREELSAFIHYGMNTFTGKEWGDGKEDPQWFKPTQLNTDQWVSTLKNAGFKRIIMIGRHHDGFCLWKSNYTSHQVNMSKDFQDISAFLHQSGDVIEEISKSCSKYDMNMGFYLSPWDANSKYYGDEVKYNEYYMNQLTEVLKSNGRYGNKGKIVEVWMDGAKGTGAQYQKYWFTEWFDLIESLQPGAVIFSPYGTTIRWIGNEAGHAGDTCWSRLSQKRQRDYYDTYGGDETGYENTGDPDGDIWSTGECDVSLTSGWFWKSGKTPKSMKELTSIYFASVGHGQPFLLNVPPDTKGEFPQVFVDRLKELSETIAKSFSHNFASQPNVVATASSIRGDDDKNFGAGNAIDDNINTYWTMNDGQLTGSVTIDFKQARTFDIVSIQEHINLGQRVTKFSVEYENNGQWQLFEAGTTIGAKRLCRQLPVTSQKVRINILGSQAVPLIERIGVFKAYGEFSMGDMIPDNLEEIKTSEMTLTGSWQTEAEGIFSKQSGASASAKFTGTRAHIVGIFDPAHGLMDVYIDDSKVATVDTYRSDRSLRQLLYATDSLSDGEHTLKVVVVSKAIALHGFYILNNKNVGMYEIESLTYSTIKGDDVTLTVKRVGGSKGKSQVTFQTAPGSAVHGRHYVDITKDLVFADGETSKQVTVQTIKNTELTGNLTFFGEILDATNDAIVGFNASSIVTIIELNNWEKLNNWRKLNNKEKLNNDNLQMKKKSPSTFAIVAAAIIGVVAVAVVIAAYVLKTKSGEKIPNESILLPQEKTYTA